ncbi:MAG: glutathione S-transferase family protein [Pseudomonadota bacterium]
MLLTLIQYPLCPFSRSIRLCCAELGITIECVEEKPWEWRQEFLEVNPAGTLPVLVIDDEITICGYYAISEYLSEVAVSDLGGNEHFAFFLNTPHLRAEARRLVDWFHNKFHSEVSAYLLEEKLYSRFKETASGPEPAIVRIAKQNLRYHLRYIGYLFERRNWLAGPEMSYADLSAAAHLSVIDYFGDVPWEDFMLAKNWYARVKSRPSFRTFLSEKVPGIFPASVYSDLDF